jgi:prepilin-type processing-associated H-X9-DG protein
MKGSSRAIVWIVGLFLLMIPCACAGLSPAFLNLEMVGLLAFGWIGFLSRVMPQVQVRWDTVATSAVCTIVLIIGSHSFLRWLYDQTRADGSSPDVRRWHWRWTISGAALVLLMFSAGIGAGGVIHQMAWLATSPVHLMRLGSEGPYRVKCASNLKQIGQAIEMYTQENKGKYPDDFMTLLLTEDITPAVFICPESDDMPATGTDPIEAIRHINDPHRCSYTYFGKGLSTPVDPNRVIAAEKEEYHEGEGMNILFGDGHVNFVNTDEADKLLATVGATLQLTPNGP